ncbi:MAG: OmpA family protein, partial [Proteobacteria bacterium]|nr:OmpA family protein [Pseudomonadota bacterium]
APAPEPAPAAEAAPAPDADDLAKALAGQAAPSPDAVPDLPAQPDPASGAAPVAAAAGLAAPEGGAGTLPPATAPAPAGSVAQVTEETVTTDTARSSSEDFANRVNQPAAPAPAAASAGTAATAAPPAPTVVERKKGLSKDEKLLLLGVGALAVGAILSNNRRVELNSGDRVVVSRNGGYDLIKDDDALLRQPGSRIRTETFTDGSTRSTVSREDGSKIVTIRDAEMRVLRRVHVAPGGYETVLIDDTVAYAPVDVTRLPPPRRLPDLTAADDEAALRRALDAQSDAGRRFSLAQIRNIAQVRALVPEIDLTAITFDTGSAAIRPDQAPALSRLGRLIQSYVQANPREIFLIEGHTDAVGGAAYNLALSDRRAESVALALSEYFAVPPENLVVQGYGEAFLKVPSQGDERRNRRAAVRRITGLLQQE